MEKRKRGKEGEGRRREKEVKKGRVKKRKKRGGEREGRCSEREQKKICMVAWLPHPAVVVARAP